MSPPDNIVRTKLTALVALHGHVVAEDERLFRAKMLDHCPGRLLEINLLAAAIASRIPVQLQSTPAEQLPIVVTRLAAQLTSSYGFQDTLSRWAVESWAIALGLSPSLNSAPPPVLPAMSPTPQPLPVSFHTMPAPWVPPPPSSFRIPLPAVIVLVLMGLIGAGLATFWFARRPPLRAVAPISPPTTPYTQPEVRQPKPPEDPAPAISQHDQVPPNTGDTPKSREESQPPMPAADDPTKPYRAVSLAIHRLDWIDRYEQAIDEIADLGADSVTLTISLWQDNISSSNPAAHPDRTPSVAQFTRLVRHARRKSLRVLVEPVINLENPGAGWRGTLKPANPSLWWAYYRGALLRYAEAAQAEGASVFLIGVELITMEDQYDEWVLTIQEIRKKFTGRLSYSANWDHYRSIRFWNQLDFVAMNSFWKLGNDKDVTVPEIVENWKKIQSELLEYLGSVHKPLLLVEVGWCSQDSAAVAPWDYTQDVPGNVALQQRLYEGFAKAWSDQQWLGGYSFWEWTPDGGGENDRYFTPKNKATEANLRRIFSRQPKPVLIP